MKPVHLWTTAAVGIVAIGFVRWPRPAPPPADTVACGASTEAFRATMRARLEAMQATIEAAAAWNPAARAASARAGRALEIPSDCAVPEGWAAHAAEQDRHWTRLMASEADEAEVASALRALSGTCIGCHQAHELER